MSTAAADRIRVGVDVVVLTLARRVPPGADCADVLPAVEVHLWRADDRTDRLPGVALRPTEDPEQAARRVLADIGIPDPRHLEQLASFGAPGRVPGIRTLSVSHLALLPEPSLPTDDGHGGRWVPLSATAGAAGFVWDHRAILAAGVERVRSKLAYSTIARGLLPDAFTMSELQEVYEAVLDTTLDKRNFRKRIMALDLLIDTGAMRRGPHRPARLHTFASNDLVVLNDVVLRTGS